MKFADKEDQLYYLTGADVATSIAPDLEKQNIELKAEVARLVGEVVAWSDNFLEEQKECHAAVLERVRLRALVTESEKRRELLYLATEGYQEKCKEFESLIAVKDAALSLIKEQNYSAASTCGMCKRILTVSGEVATGMAAWNGLHCGWCPIPQVEQALEAK